MLKTWDDLQKRSKGEDFVGCPLETDSCVPNAETLAAIDDVNHGRNLSKAFHSVAELMEDLNDK